MENTVKQLIHRKDLVVFSKSYCPYCKQVKQVFKSRNLNPEIIELDIHPDGKQIQQVLMKKTNHSTVPSVWFQGRYVGGSSESITKAQNGTFDLSR